MNLKVPPNFSRSGMLQNNVAVAVPHATLSIQHVQCNLIYYKLSYNKLFWSSYIDYLGPTHSNVCLLVSRILGIVWHSARRTGIIEFP